MTFFKIENSLLIQCRAIHNGIADSDTQINMSYSKLKTMYKVINVNGIKSH